MEVWAKLNLFNTLSIVAGLCEHAGTAVRHGCLLHCAPFHRCYGRETDNSQWALLDEAAGEALHLQHHSA